MGKNLPVQVGSVRWFAGCLTLCLYLFAAFQPASAAVALFFAGLHGHAHEVTLRADGQHFDLVLSHHDEHEVPDDHHAWPGEIFSALSVTHDHEGNDHVLHFIRGVTSDQSKVRIDVPRTTAHQSVSLAVGSLAIQAPAAGNLLKAAWPPPAVAPALTCLRSTVLLV